MSDEPDDYLKIPSSVPWRRISIGLGIAAVVVAGAYGVSAVEDCKRAREQEEQAQLDEQASALEAELWPRLEAAREAVISFAPSSDSSPCPADVSQAQPLALAQLEWLAWLLDEGRRSRPPETPPHSLNSDVINLLAGVFSGGGTKALERRNRLYEALAHSRYVAVFSAASVEPARALGQSTFEGGSVGGQLLVVDVTEGVVVCHINLASQAYFALHLAQGTPEADRDEERRALRNSTALAFWQAAGERLAEISSDLRLDEPAPR